MSTLVINRQSVSVKIEANHLVLHEHADGGSFARMPLVDIERVIIVGQPAITFPVFAKLMDLGIPCSFLTHSGCWRGMMDGDPGFHALRGIEGMAANVYFSLLGRFFPTEVPFHGRSRRPPRDAANALMSFVYTLLVNAFAATARAHGLDVAPYRIRHF
jgi:CRISPR/Cas system-associated endonuclease Cas1